jgi:hypothetical protein
MGESHRQVRLTPLAAPTAARGAGADAAFEATPSASAAAAGAVTARVMLDAMGNFSPVMRQVCFYIAVCF